MSRRRTNRERQQDLDELVKEIHRLGCKLPDFFDNIEDYEGYYECQSYHIQHAFSFSSEQHIYSCAIPTYGNFSGLRAPVPVMVLLLKLALLVDERQGYAQAITLTTPEYNNLNRALKQAGFVETARVRTRMGGRYKNIVWQYNANK